MSSERLPPAEIEAMKQRINEQLEDAEAAYRAYIAWQINWRIRMAAKREHAELSGSGEAG
jgi:hypothetical protein